MRWLLRFRVCIIICLAVLLISAAVLFSVLRAVLPHATGYKNEIELEISRQIGLPVEVETIDAAIHWFSPRLKLINVSVFDEKNKVPLFNFKEAFVELDVVSSVVRSDIIIDDIGLIGADISIEKLSDTRWSLQGIEFSSEGASELPDRFLYMLLNSDYLLRDCNIYYQDHTGEKLALSLLDINMDVINNFNNHKIKFSMSLPEDYGRSLVVIADLQGDLDSLDGEFYVEAKQINIRQWDKKFHVLDDYRIDAMVDVNLWGTLRDSKVTLLTSELEAAGLYLRNNATAKVWKTEFLTTKFRFFRNKEHWNLAVSDFYFGAEDNPSWGRPANAHASDDAEYYYLSADFLRISDLREIAAVVSTPGLNKKFNKFSEELKSHQVHADIYNLALQLPKDLSKVNVLEKMVLDVTVNDFSMVDSANHFSVSGLDLSLHFDNNRALLELQTKDADFEFTEMFRQPVTIETLQGKLSADYLDDGWKINSHRLQIKNSHLNSFSRLDLRISPDNKIFADIQTDFYDAYGKYARYYLPVGIMDQALVDWLDMAVTDGYVPEGSFILRGELADFPYLNQEGVFQVLFSAKNVNMKFLEGWPLLTDTSADLKFNNQSLFISNAKAKTQNIEMFDGYAEFLNLEQPHLTVKTSARGQNDELQSYVWNSPLDEILGDGLRLFQFEGKNSLRLALEIPLDKDDVDVSLDGHLTFYDTAIYYPELGYEMNDINGIIDFTDTSIFADTIVARVDNKPVSVNAFTENGSAGSQVVFRIDGEMDIDYLLQRYDWIPDNWLTGTAVWSMDFEVPDEPEDYLVHIEVNSYVEDVVVRVSDKVNKPAAKKINFTAGIDVLDNENLKVNARLLNPDDSTIVDLFASRSENSLWSFDLKSKYMTGKGEFTEGLGKDTQLKLDLEEIDVHALFYSEKKTGSKALLPSDFPPLGWRAKKVLWDNRVFTDVVTETSWHKHGMLINNFSLKGPAMSFSAQGTWLTSWNGAHETVMQGNISSSNCGETLVGLGYQRSLDRCTYAATFKSRWPEEPYQLSWANMKGKTSFEMHDGEILDVDPGTGGRLLGLMNIFKLTNRLVLDFDDVTRKGFSFDTIKGDFEFVNGDGSLKNFDVSATAADINMFGSIGMVKHDYGLLMRVKPHTDSLTFAGGTLLGGVAVGAGLALIQKVFDLGVIGHNVYSITGSWDEPVIEKIVQRNRDSDDDDFNDE